MMAEQSDGTPPRIKVLKSGERVIVDNELTVSRSYMYFYLLLNIGAAVGQICIPLSLSLSLSAPTTLANSVQV